MQQLSLWTKLRFLTSILVLLMSSPSWAEGKRLKACGNDEYPPWNWLNGKEIVGACVDLAREAFASKGYTLDLSYVGPWARCQALLEAGRVDISICAVPTPERLDSLYIIQPSLGTNEIFPFVLKSSQIRINTLEDLFTLRVGLVRGVRLGEPLDTILAVKGKVTYVNRSEAAWSLLLLKRIDVVVFGRESGNVQLKQLKLEEKIVHSPSMLSKVSLNVMLSKKSKYFDEIGPDLFDIGKFFSRPDHYSDLGMSLAKNTEIYLQVSPKNILGNKEIERALNAP